MKYAVRLNSFRAPHSKATGVDLIGRSSQVKGATHVDINYPEHFDGTDQKKIKNILDKTDLKLNSVQMRYKDDSRFNLSGLTSPNPKIRKTAVEMTYRAIDSLIYLGSDLLTIWPSQEGFDYPFQVNYSESYQLLVDSLKKILNYNSSIKLSIEYKPNDPHAISLIQNAASAILLANDVSTDRAGLTLDFCHSLMAQESPAASASLIMDKSQLLGIHLNDGYGLRDDGLMVASIHPFQTIELMYVLCNQNFSGVIYFDTFPTYSDSVKEYTQNISVTEKIIKLVSKKNFSYKDINLFNF